MRAPSGALEEECLGEWPYEKHGGKPCRNWRRLHLAVDPGIGDIRAAELTTTNEGDACVHQGAGLAHIVTLGCHRRAGGEQILDLGSAKADFLQHVPGFPAARLRGAAQWWISLIAADR
jgi:hypothetical protein